MKQKNVKREEDSQSSTDSQCSLNDSHTIHDGLQISWFQSFSKLFLPCRFGETFDTLSLLLSSSSASSFSSFFVSCFHLRSLRDPANVFVRQSQVLQFKSWLNSLVFPFLISRSIWVTHWMVVGDFNDYDNEVLDRFNNRNYFLVKSENGSSSFDESRRADEVAEANSAVGILKRLYSDTRYDERFRRMGVNKLVNSGAYRESYTRFTNSYISNGGVS